jgi:hypothetical protein
MTVSKGQFPAVEFNDNISWSSALGEANKSGCLMQAAPLLGFSMKKFLTILIIVFIALSVMFGVFQVLANGNCELGIASVSPFGYKCK